jgi:hypothetical protein
VQEVPENTRGGRAGQSAGAGRVLGWVAPTMWHFESLEPHP